MKKLSLVFRGLAVSAGLAAAAAWVTTHGRLDDMQGRFEAASGQLQSTRSELVGARDQATALQTSLESTRKDLASAKQRATQFQDQYFLSAQECSRLQTLVQEGEALATRLREENKQLQHEIVSVKSPPSPEWDHSEELLGYQRRIAGLEAEIQDLQQRLSGRSADALRSSPLEPESDATPPPTSRRSINATIAGIRREGGLLVFDQGRRAGIATNDEFILVKNGTELGKIRVTALNDLGSVGALISSTEPGISLNIGDSIWLNQ